MATLFGPTSPPGAEESFTADRAGRRRGDRAAAGVLVVEGGVPASDLQLEIARATPSRDKARSSCPDPLADPRLDFQVDRASALAYEVKAGEYDPGDRRAGPPVLRLPRLQRAEAAGGQGARSRRDRDALPDGQRLPRTRPLLQVLRRRPRAARRGRARHGRPPRHVRPRLHGQVLRGHGLLRPRQLLRQLQCRADAVHDRAAQGLARDQLLLQHVVRRAQPVLDGRALVASGRLRPAARDDRPRLPLERVPRRHRPGQRLEPHGGARARLPRQGALLRRDRPSRHARRGAEADPGDGLPAEDVRADEPIHRVQRLLAADVLRQPRARSPSTGPAARRRRSWTSRRCASSRSSGRTPWS